MKVTVIPDLHGRSTWKDIVDLNPGSHYIFLGDYVDPYDTEFIDEEESMDNLYDLLDFKRTNPNKVTFLIGNHDAQYLFYPYYRVVDFKADYLRELLDVFDANKNYFQFAVQKGNYLFTHAGVTNAWFNNYKKLFYYQGLEFNMSNFAVILNKIGADSRWRDYLLDTSKVRKGIDEFAGPLWADKKETAIDFLDGFHQVVGHSKVMDIIKIGDQKSSITYADVLWRKTRAVTLNI